MLKVRYVKRDRVAHMWRKGIPKQKEQEKKYPQNVKHFQDLIPRKVIAPNGVIHRASTTSSARLEELAHLIHALVI